MAMSGRLRDLVNYGPMHLFSTIIVFIKQEMREKKNLVVLIAICRGIESALLEDKDSAETIVST